jgi:rSAM/selenodomain-associated transferase 2
MDPELPMQRQPDISVIIPVLHEQKDLPACLSGLRQQANSHACEIIVVDGDPEGSTLDIIQDPDIVKLCSSPGRAVQMNTGAERAKGAILVFLHADTQLPDRAFLTIQQALADPLIIGGAFDLGIASHRMTLKWIAWHASLRSRLNRIPYGDQAIFLRKSVFEHVGRYNPFPIMEDVDLMRRLKKGGYRITLLRDKVLTSPRRWETEGPIYTTLRNQCLMALFYLGVSPKTLARFYKSQNVLRKSRLSREPSQTLIV